MPVIPHFEMRDALIFLILLHILGWRSGFSRKLRRDYFCSNGQAKSHEVRERDTYLFPFSLLAVYECMCACNFWSKIMCWCSGSVSVRGMNCKFNLSEHVKVHNNFSSQEKFLSSNFLFSLSCQKPQVEAVGARYICNQSVFLLKIITSVNILRLHLYMPS